VTGIGGAWPNDPVVHEIFAWVWLADLRHQFGRQVTLADVPDEVWDDMARPGIDAVWLMGVWQRSTMGAAIARTNPAMRAAHQAALPVLTDADVVGSAYCVRDYHVDPHLGGDDGLAVARAALARRGVRLILDLVPNHVAPDHPWVDLHPEYFVQGTADDLQREPDGFLQVGARVLACGRDPYFPAWPEVLQLDASHAGLRAAMAELVVELTGVCDGIRCDMAMLVLDDVFHRTWGDRAVGGSQPQHGMGFWPMVISAAKSARPDFAMWAEAYWDLEDELLRQGFDACYDKQLYDRVVHRAPISEVRARLAAPVDGQQHTVRFVENHDEPRAASLLSREAHLAALTAVLTLPGVALLHEGEADGRTVHVPVTLGRRPMEQPDTALRAGVNNLLDILATGLRRGEWAAVSVEGWPDNPSAERLLAWSWTGAEARHLVVVNLTEERADGRVIWPWAGDGSDAAIELHDLLSGARFERDGATVSSEGLYVGLDRCSAHLFRLGAR
jgi:hypothetical protein